MKIAEAQITLSLRNSLSNFPCTRIGIQSNNIMRTASTLHAIVNLFQSIIRNQNENGKVLYFFLFIENSLIFQSLL